MSAADRFLKKKRAEQGNGSSMTQGARPPSMEARHGLDKMGGYQTSMGQFTGNGPDGITQPQLPTQRRMTPNGQPYMVDEGELLVVDAQTLSDYGGPEQLEAFIKENAPSRTKQVPQYYGGGVPQYGGGAPRYGGNVPTRQRGPSTFGNPDMSQFGKNPTYGGSNKGTKSPFGQGTPGQSQNPMGLKTFQGSMGIKTPFNPNAIGTPNVQVNPRPQTSQNIGNVDSWTKQGSLVGQGTTQNADDWQQKKGTVVSGQGQMVSGDSQNADDWIGQGTVVSGQGQQTGIPGTVVNSQGTQENVGTQQSMAGRTRQRGVPTRQRGFPDPDQTQMLKEVKSGIEQYQEGGAPKPQESIAPKTRNPSPIPDPFNNDPKIGPDPNKDPFGTNLGKKIKEPVIPDLKDPIIPKTVQGDVVSPIVDPTIPVLQDPTIPVTVQGPVVTDPNKQYTPVQGGFTPQGPDIGPKAVTDQGFTPSGDPLKTTTDPVQTTDPVTGAPVYDPSKIDEMMWNRYLGRMGAQQEAQRAGEAQRGLQAGMSEREIAGRGAIGDISRREAMGEATADFGIDAAQREENRVIRQQAQDNWQKQFDFTKKKYGDQEGGRIAADIAAGMTFDQIKAKYPNMTEADYNSMKEAGSLGDKDWDKQMMKFDTLVAAGDYENAQGVWNAMFPDTPIDFQKLIDEGNMDNFNTGMGQMSKYIASGLTWDEALKAMEKDGTLNNLGMSEEDAKDLYETLQIKSSPIWQIANTIDDEMLEQLFPEWSVEEARANITKLALFGGMTVNDDGTFSFDYELMNEMFGGQGDGGDYTYTDYKEAAEKAGETALSEEDWIKGGSKKFKESEYTYDDYRKAAEEAGQIPMQKDEWERNDSPEYEPKGAAEMYDDFLGDVPDPGNWTYEKWVGEGRPHSFGAWEFTKTQTIGDIEKIVSKYKEDGWPSFSSDDENHRDLVESGRNIYENRQGEIWKTSFDDIMKVYDNAEGNASQKNLAVKNKFVEGKAIKIKGDPGLYVIQSVPSSGGNKVVVVDVVTGKKSNLIWYNGKAFIEPFPT